MQFETLIGLEVHAQLLTETKLFCSCTNKYGELPNTAVCQVCAGFPGALPVLNNKALEFALKTAGALNLKIGPIINFSRKNYFYPDLPKGYQISQFDLPVAVSGDIEINVNGKIKRIGILRLHLEEDAGKLIHGVDEKSTEAGFIDYNRAGVPLMEIVSGPDMKSAEEAAEYLKRLIFVLRYLEVCDVKMEEGSIRCDVNISVHEKGADEPGTRVEIKNLNSVRHMIRAIEFERQRQAVIINSGGTIYQETRLWDEKKQATVLMRGKEYSGDYRYFPEPDIPAVRIDGKLIDRMKTEIPELPKEKISRFVREYGVSLNDAEILTEYRQMADYFEEAVLINNDPETVCKWLLNIIRNKLSDPGDICSFPVKPADLSQLLRMVDNGTISLRIAKSVFEEMFNSGKKAKEIVSQKDLIQIVDKDKIGIIIQAVMDENRKLVEAYRGGKNNLYSYFVGQIMKKTGGKASPDVIGKILNKRLLNG